MADGFIRVPVDDVGKRVDQTELTVNALLVERQRAVIAGGADIELADVKNTVPAAAAYGLVARATGRREGQVLSTAALGNGGVYTQAWQDSNADGTKFVEAAARADQASAASGFVIQETDDDSDANFTRTVTSATVSANTTTFLRANIRGRKYRVQYTNGGVGQGSFKVASSTSNFAGVAGTADDPLRVDPTGTTAQPVTGTFWQATQPVSGTVTANLGTIAGVATEATLDARTGTLTEAAPGTDTASSGINGRLQRIAQRLTSLIALLPTALGQSTMANSLRVVLASDQTDLGVNVKSIAAGGYTTATLVSAATTNGTSLKASAGKLGFVTASNINAAVRYLKFYNKASAPTVGTDTPVLTFAIPGNTAGAGTNIPIPDAGLDFATGIAYALTTGVTTADTGAVAANEIVVNLGYK